MVGWVQTAKTTSPLLLRPKVQGCVCQRKVGEWECSYSPLRDLGDAAWGYSGRPATPDWGARLRGWRSIRSKCPPSWSLHCSAPLSCFVGRLDLTLTVSLSLHITLNNHHPSEKAIKLGKPFKTASNAPLLSQSHHSPSNAIPLLILRYGESNSTTAPTPQLSKRHQGGKDGVQIYTGFFQAA